MVATERVVTASFTMSDHELKDIPVLNPGAWWGRTYLIEIGGSYTAFYLIVEADNMSDAIDELADNEQYGHQIRVDDANLGDYPEDDRHYAGNCGHVVDLDWIMVYGPDGRHDKPFACRYHTDGLPAKGINPLNYSQWLDWIDG